MPPDSILRWPRVAHRRLRAAAHTAVCLAAVALPLMGTPAGHAAQSVAERMVERPTPPRRLALPRRSDLNPSAERPRPQRTVAVRRPPRPATSRIVAPHVWPVIGRVSSPFGWRQHPVSGHHRHHDGVDLAVPLGTAVRSVSPGVVRLAERRNGYGLVIEVEHSERYRTRYAHLSASHVVPGMHVRAGQVVGASGGVPGRDGLSTGPHLHFEVRDHAGRALDPADFLRASKRRRVTAERGRQVMFSSGRKRSAARPQARSPWRSRRLAALAFARPLRAGSRGAR